MKAIEITYELALAAGRDAANRQMCKAGRKTWSVDDWNLASKVTNEIYDHYHGYDDVSSVASKEHY